MEDTELNLKKIEELERQLKALKEKTLEQSSQTKNNQSRKKGKSFQGKGKKRNESTRDKEKKKEIGSSQQKKRPDFMFCVKGDDVLGQPWKMRYFALSLLSTVQVLSQENVLLSLCDTGKTKGLAHLEEICSDPMTQKRFCSPFQHYVLPVLVWFSHSQVQHCSSVQARNQVLRAITGNPGFFHRCYVQISKLIKAESFKDPLVDEKREILEFGDAGWLPESWDDVISPVLCLLKCCLWSSREFTRDVELLEEAKVFVQHTVRKSSCFPQLNSSTKQTLRTVEAAISDSLARAKGDEPEEAQSLMAEIYGHNNNNAKQDSDEEDGPGEKSASGSRHDNDYEEFRKIQIFPTQAELLSERDPFVPKNRNVHDNVQRYLDTQFRLLRLDVVEPLRQGIQAFVRSGGVSGESKLCH